MQVSLLGGLIKQNIFRDWIVGGLFKELKMQTQRIQIYSPQNVWIHSSYFLNITEKGERGGAICMSTNSNRTYLLVEHSNFHNCICSYVGGSIYQTPGNFLLHYICSTCDHIDFYSGDGTHIYSKSTNSYDHIQDIEYCSINSNVNSELSYLHKGPLVLYEGCISIKSLNISQERLKEAHFLIIASGMQNNNNIIEYSSFVNSTNNSAREIYLFFDFNNIKQFFMCNVIKNVAESIYNINKEFTIKNSCILENKCINLFITHYDSNYSNYVINLFNTTCQQISSNYIGKINIYESPISPFMHALDCIKTGYCIAEYDYLDYLTPYIPSDDDDNNIETLSYMKHINNNRYLIY